MKPGEASNRALETADPMPPFDGLVTAVGDRRYVCLKTSLDFDMPDCISSDERIVTSGSACTICRWR